jgi:phosphopantothenoylcysteine decarboxylase / phosphopantothenate---cysteine ligase
MKVLLGIAGGIAAYKSPEVVRALRKRGHEVRCILTASGAKLVSEHALAAVSNQPVATSMWPADGHMPHIELARWCETLLIAPATADCLAKFALGLADDLLTTLFLALEPDRRVILAPAMNPVMWQKPVVQLHVATLKERGASLALPVEGLLACGESGIGAMGDPEQLAAAVG